MNLSLRLIAAVVAASLVACAGSKDNLPPTNPLKGNRSERELRLEAEGLYKLARRSLDTADFPGALQRYDQLQLRYPFTDYATQAQLESVYARYRSYDPDGAITTADRFLKEHPRHPAVDYVYYLKGLVNYQRGESAFDWIMESARQDVSHARRAFDDFALLVQKYPNSRFASDARLRMVHLRNKIARHELSVARYYQRRGAHLAAAKRAEKIIAEYPGAPATAEALALLERSYREIGLDAQAADVRKLLAVNPEAAAAAAKAQRPVVGLFSSPPDPIPAPSDARPPGMDSTITPGERVQPVTGEPKSEMPPTDPATGTPATPVEPE